MAYRRKKRMSLRKMFKNHRHRVFKSMKGLTSIPTRFRGRRL